MPLALERWQAVTLEEIVATFQPLMVEVV